MSEASFEQLSGELRNAFNADHFASTIVLARKLLAGDPTHAPTLTQLGRALFELANYDEAEIVLRQALEYWGDLRRELIYGELGHLFKSRGDYETAAEWYRKAIDLSPDDADGYIFLGAVLAKQGKLTEAETTHRTATQCADGCIDEAYHNLGLVLRGQGRFEESRECLVRALELDPEYTAAQEALDDIQTAISYSSEGSLDQFPPIVVHGAGGRITEARLMP